MQEWLTKRGHYNESLERLYRSGRKTPMDFVVPRTMWCILQTACRWSTFETLCKKMCEKTRHKPCKVKDDDGIVIAEQCPSSEWPAAAPAPRRLLLAVAWCCWPQRGRPRMLVEYGRTRVVGAERAQRVATPSRQDKALTMRSQALLSNLDSDSDDKTCCAIV